jgi:hypothetical protein
MKLRLLRVAVSVIVTAAVATACTEKPAVVPSRNFDRPTDMAFVCMGVFDLDSPQGRVSGRPMAECHPPGQFDRPADVSRRTFGFVTNTARGELSVVDIDNARLLDLDKAVPGFNVAPLGVLPEAMVASDDGCLLATANRGSCDLSLVDPAGLLAPTLSAEARTALSIPDSQGVSRTVRVQTAAGTALNVAPHEIVFLPQDTADRLTGEQNLCVPEGSWASPAGWPASKTPTPWKAIVTFPSCDLVALVDLPSGVISDSVFVRRSADGASINLVPAGANPVCPYVDCGAGARPPGVPTDAGAGNADADVDADQPDGETATNAGVDDGGTGAAADAAGDAGSTVDGPAGGGLRLPPDQPSFGLGPLRPGPLAIVPDGTRAYVGLLNASFVAALEVSPAGFAVPAASRHGSIYLHEGALGTTRVRLSIDPYQLPESAGDGFYGRFVGAGPNGERQFLYAIARDGTVRVIHVSPRNQNADETECDTNVDPQKISAQERLNPCFPVDPLRRRPLARGPGIRLPSIPRDVAFVDLPLNDPAENAVNGAYGFVLTANGVVFLVNIAPVLRQFGGVVAGEQVTLSEPPPLVNTLRDRNVVAYKRELGPSLGPPRVDLPPVVPPTGPRIEGIITTDSSDNPLITAALTPLRTYVFFPDRGTVTNQTWRISWEGDLLADPRFAGQVEGPLPNGLGRLKDRVNFCQTGALAGDILTIFGCQEDAHCGLGQVCERSTAAAQSAGLLPINGICLDPDPVTQTRQKASCAQFLESVKRYEIVEAMPNVLTVRPKIDEIVKPSVMACETDDDCRPEADPQRQQFTCKMVGGARRCVQECELDDAAAQCRPGRVCVDFGATDGTLCADAPPLDEACFPQLTGYKVQVGRGFLVRGSSLFSLDMVTEEAPPGSQCVPDPARHPLVTMRIPMNAPACAPSLDDPNLDGRLEDEATRARFMAIARTPASDDPAGNPCLFVAGPTVGDPVLPPGQPPQRHVRALFQNPEIRFVLTNLEQYFGDSMEITFEVNGGFLSQAVLIPDTISIGMPARLLVSPLDSQEQRFDGTPTRELPFLYMVDQRRVGSSRIGATRGQILRIDPHSPLQMPIYQDFQTSMGGYPIQ